MPQAESKNSSSSVWSRIGGTFTLQELARVFFPEGLVPEIASSAATPTPATKVAAEPPNAEARYRVLLDQIPAVVFMAYLDRGFGESYVSPHIEAILGFKQEEWLREPIRWYQQIHPEDKTRWSTEAAQLFLTGEPLRSIYRVIARDGRVVWFQCEAKMIRSEDGRPWFIHGVGFDITELKQSQGLVENALKAAEAANRTKSEFLANMSHEIRTPVNGIMGMTQLALDTDLTLVQREYLSIVKSSADSLLRLIDDILDFSKIESKKLDLQVVAFNLYLCIEDTMKALKLLARQKDLELTFHVAETAKGMLMGDPARLRQVLINLLGNAIKFTPKGTVSLKVETETLTAGDVLLHFQVTDTGIGIPRDKLQLIFAPFQQADGSSTRRFGGTGLGLSISQQLIQMMGGRIWIESEVGRGSTFHFTARFSVAKSAPEQKSLAPGEPPSETGKPLRILLAEDNAVNQKVAGGLLRKRGHQVTVANTGIEALKALDGSRFDLLLLDLQMPEMDGFETIEALQAMEKMSGARMPVIALTAHTMKADREKCLAAGMDDFVSKPINSKDLFAAINRLTAS